MYKLKITGSKKAKILMWEHSPDSEGIETYIRQTLEFIRATHKMKLTSCNLFLGDGTFLKCYSHLIKTLQNG